MVLAAPPAAGNCRSLYGLGGPIDGTIMFLFFNLSLLDLVSSSGAVRIKTFDATSMLKMKNENLQNTLTFVGFGGGTESCACEKIDGVRICVCLYVRMYTHVFVFTYARVLKVCTTYRWLIGEVN